MYDINIISDIVIPLVASVIGGLLTLGGVIITINSQKKKDKEDRRMSIKPYFYAMNAYQRLDGLEKADCYTMIENNKEKGNYEIEGIIKNTDNAIMILKEIIIDGRHYYPEYGNIIDKNTLFYLYVFPNKIIEDVNSIYFIISDVMNNKYKYKLICEYDGKKYYGIKAFEEEKNKTEEF